MATLENDTRELAALRARLADAEAALDAIRSGVADAIVGEAGDISHRFGAERPYATFFDAMNEGGVTLDSRGVILHCNPCFAAMLDHPIEDLRGALFVSRVESDKRTQTEELLASNSGALEVSLDTAAGPLPVRLSLKSVDTGLAQFRCLVVTDLSQHARAEAELRIAAIAFESQEGMVITDARQVILRANHAFADITGHLAEEVIGQTLGLLESDRHDAAFYAAMRESIRLAGAWQGEIWSRRKNGEVYPAWLTVTAVDGSAGNVTHYVGTFTDITEKKRTEEEIQRYVVQLRNAFMSTVEVAMTLSEMRDPYTAGHERRVATIAAAIGTELGFDEARIEGLRVAGSLHDVGKMTIPSDILSKPGRLSALEFQLIQGHASASYDVLKEVEFPWPVAQVALQHHERMDGSGYPRGLKGEEIILEARILAVADVVEAMISYRPYRAGLGVEAALAEIERGASTAYDSIVADACLSLFRERSYALPA